MIVLWPLWSHAGLTKRCIYYSILRNISSNISSTNVSGQTLSFIRCLCARGWFEGMVRRGSKDCRNCSKKQNNLCNGGNITRTLEVFAIFAARRVKKKNAEYRARRAVGERKCSKTLQRYWYRARRCFQVIGRNSSKDLAAFYAALFGHVAHVSRCRIRSTFLSYLRSVRSCRPSLLCTDHCFSLSKIKTSDCRLVSLSPRWRVCARFARP